MLSAFAAANQAPTADSQTVLMSETDPDVDIILTGSDFENDELVFSIDSGPSNGTLDPLPPTPLSSTSAGVTYTPDGTARADNFTFRVTDPDGSFGQAVVTIDITATPPPPPNPLPTPTADPQNVETDGTNNLPITLTGSDSDGESLTFAIVSGPSLGSLGAVTQAPPSSATVTYTAGQTGDLEDSFVFQATNESGVVDEATVFINLADGTPEDPTPTDAVVVKDDSVEAINGQSLTLTLVGSADIADPGTAGDFTFTIFSGPTNGTLSNLTHIIPAEIINPNPPPPTIQPPIKSATIDFVSTTDGADSFVIQGCADLNGNGDTLDPGECDTATISVAVDTFTPPPPPVAPTAQDLQVTTPEETAATISLTSLSGGGSTDPNDGPGGSSGHPLSAEVAVTLPGGPNLTVPIFNAPACAVVGDAVGGQIQVRVTNIGPAVIPAGTAAAIGFYVSTDAVITTSDTLLTGGRENILTQAPDGLLVGQSIDNFLFAGASIPGSPLGNVFIGVLADEFDVLDEDNEGDNTAAQAIQILASGSCATAPDLVISSILHSPPDPVGFGSISFIATVKNDGDDLAADSTLCFAIGALGEDCNSTAALFNVPFLTAGATHTEVRTEDVAVGTTVNLAVADLNDDVAESNEQNNSATDTVSVAAASLRLTATIEVLPTAGTLSGTTLTSGGALVAITTVPTDLTATSVSYTSDPLPIGEPEGTDFFEYTLFDTSTGLISLQGRVDLTISQVIDPCVANGREAGCSPGQ